MADPNDKKRQNNMSFPIIYRGHEMKAECEWERFTSSGRIADYLAFKDKEAREREPERAGEQFYAGFCSSDRKRNQNNSCR